MIKTITIQVGNSDNKLSQSDWHLFVLKIGRILDSWAKNIHFSGGSASDAAWQNYCWVIEIDLNQEFEEGLKESLTNCRIEFNQDSLAYTEGKTLFV